MHRNEVMKTPNAQMQYGGDIKMHRNEIIKTLNA